MADVQPTARIAKVDDSLGIVFGWAIVCKEDGAPHFDLQGDHIPEDVMLEAATEFMAEVERIGGEMHFVDDAGAPVAKGTILFAFPMTTDIAKAMGFSGRNTGLMVAYKPSSPEMLKRCRDGVYTGFSIGGTGERAAA